MSDYDDLHSAMALMPVIAQLMDRLEMQDEALFAVAESSGDYREEHYSRRLLAETAKQLGIRAGMITQATTGGVPETENLVAMIRTLHANLLTMSDLYAEQIERIGGK